ncbi:hypothetical protein PG994_002692 [Apiospora phragmitis]|uniref:Uncharacterized protein n=1 Tax=Apiospora phragmitis TaxID=2905665 RepID=A0ABR1W5Y5_9PEZI
MSNAIEFWGFAERNRGVVKFPTQERLEQDPIPCTNISCEKLVATLRRLYGANGYEVSAQLPAIVGMIGTGCWNNLTTL